MRKRALSIICVCTAIFQTIAFAGEDLVLLQGTTEIDNEESIVFFETESSQSEESEPDKSALEYLLENAQSDDYKSVIAENNEELSGLLEEAARIFEDASATKEDVDDILVRAAALYASLSYIGERQIVSNNKFTTTQLENYYPNVEIADNTASYSYSASSPESLTGDDAQNTVLADGVLDTYIKTTSSDTDATEIVYDLGENYYVSDIELFSGFYYNRNNPVKRNIRNIEGYSVLVSTDGETYKKAAKVKAKTEPDENDPDGVVNTTISTKAHILAQNVRYVKVIVEKYEASTYYQLGELVIKGFTLPDPREELYALLKQYRNVDSGAYKNGYALFDKEYKEAESLYFNESSDKAELFKAINELKKAFSGLEKTTERYIISGNVFSTADAENYEGIEKLKDTNISYSYEEGDPQNWNTNDVDHAKLFGGNLTSTGAENMSYGKWKDSVNVKAEGKVIFNMGATAYITGVDLWSNQRRDAHIQNILIEVSDDGISYTKIAEKDFTAPENSAFQVERLQIPVEEEPVPCRYVRMTLSTMNKQMNLNEVVMFGYMGSSAGKDIPLKLNNLDYTDSQGNLIHMLAGENTVKICGNIQSQINEDKNVHVISVAYDDKENAVGAAWSKVLVKAGGGQLFENTVNLPEENGYSLKTYVWDDIESGISMSQVAEFGTFRNSLINTSVSGVKNSVDNVQYDYVTKKLVVRGTVAYDKNSGFREVSLRLIAPAKDLSDIGDVFNKNILAQVAQISPEADGSFEFSYVMSDIQHGSHMLYITFADGTEKIIPVFITDKEKTDALMNSANNADTKDKMIQLFEDYEYVFDGQECYNSLLTTSSEEEVRSEIAEMICGMQFGNSEEFSKEIKMASVVICLEKSQNAEEFKNILNTWKNDIGFDKNTVYTEIYPISNNSVTESFVGKDYKTSEEFIKDFSDSVILDRINSVTNYTEVGTLLENSEEYLINANFDAYNRLSDTQKTAVQIRIIGEYSTVDAFVTAFNTAVLNPTIVTTPSGSSSSSSGGSSGSSSVSSGENAFIPVNPESIVSKQNKLFNDLDSVLWAKDSIENLTELGIVSGKGDGIFAPMDKVTREEFVKMIVCAYELFDKSAVCSFDDVNKDAWYAPYVASAYNSGLVYGVSEEEFGIGRNITREEMAVIAYRAASYGKMADDNLFADDNEISDYAKTAVYTMRAKGIMSGKGENKFVPKDFATRAEAAKILDLMLQK